MSTFETVTPAEVQPLRRRTAPVDAFADAPANSVVSVHTSRGSAQARAAQRKKRHPDQEFVARTLVDGRHVVIVNPEGI